MAENSQFVVCWLDRSYGEEGAHLSLKERFRSVSNRIGEWHYFDCGDPFQEFINTHPNLRLIVIMSGSFSKNYLTPITDRTSLHSVYILCEHIDRYRHLEREEQKVQGVFNHPDDLYDKLKRDFA